MHNDCVFVVSYWGVSAGNDTNITYYTIIECM